MRSLDLSTFARRQRVRQLLGQVITERRRTRSLLKAAAAARHGHEAASATKAPPTSSDLLIDFLIDATSDEAVASSASPSLGTGPAQPSSSSSRLSDEEVMAEALTFIMAGHETTSQALTWALLLLARHPEWRERARAQVDAVLGVGPAARLPSHEDLAAMPLLLAVMQESMRLFAPVPAVLREAARDVQLPGGLTVPASTGVAISIAAVHRDPAVWPRPDEFDPGRFEHGLAAACRHPLAWLPFVAGPRNCIGACSAVRRSRSHAPTQPRGAERQRIHSSPKCAASEPSARCWALRCYNIAASPSCFLPLPLQARSSRCSRRASCWPCSCSGWTGPLRPRTDTTRSCPSR